MLAALRAEAIGDAVMSDNDFGFSDHDLDDLPANAIEQFEAAAIRATQQPPPTANAAPESDYGLDDGDEVVNLDDAAEFAQGPRGHDSYGGAYEAYEAYEAFDEGTTIDEGNTHEHVQTVPAPRPSQADPDQLLARIKKVETLHHIAIIIH